MNRYVKIKNDLTADGHTVHVLPLPGLGLEQPVWKREIISHYGGIAACYIKHNEVDCIIGHGMGCLVAAYALWLLMSTDKVWNGKLIMVSPYYKGMRRRWLLPLFGRFSLTIFEEIRSVVGLTTRFCKPYTMRPEALDDLMISDLRCADKEVAVELLKEMADNRGTMMPSTGRSFIICGVADKLVRKRKMKVLWRDVHAEELTWLYCGHYPMVECYEVFMSTVRRCLNA